MSMTATQIFAAAQALPEGERETLCTQIAESLDVPLTPIELAWADTADRRAEELRAGEVKGIPADKVFEKAIKRLVL